MFLSATNLVEAMLWAGGMWFCIQMFLHGPEHIKKLREADEWVERVAVIALWCITGVILFLCVRFAVQTGERIVQGIRGFR
jgi:hypothetical protein